MLSSMPSDALGIHYLRSFADVKYKRGCVCIYLELKKDREGKAEVRGKDSVNRLLREGEQFILKRKDISFLFAI